MKPKTPIEKIYETALVVFAEYGYSRSTMEDIAKRLNMTKGNIYRYAKSKRDLYEKTAEYALKRWQNRVRQEIGKLSDPKEMFYVMCFSAVEYLVKDSALRKLLANDPEIFPMFPESDPFAAINRDSVALIRSILELGVKQGAFRKIDVNRVSEAVFMIYKAFVVRLYIHDADEKIFELFKDTVDIFANGLFRRGIETDPI